MDATLKTRALLDLEALGENVKTVRRLAPESKLMAVVKANAYGHGVDILARELCPMVDGFAVATIEEGISLREVDANKPVTILSGLCTHEQLDLCSGHKLDPVLHSPHHIDWLNRYSGPPLDVWLKFNSGMNRLGMAQDDFLQACRTLDENPHVDKIRLMSHFACAEDLQDNFTSEQLRRFTQVSSSQAHEKSLANSAGIICWPDAHFEWVRPGLMLYGISPFQDQAMNYRLRPVMELQAKVISIQSLARGETIGYGRTFIASHAMKIANLGIGYGDGYFRVVSDAAHVMIHGEKSPIVGRISMDSMTVDVTNIEQSQVGDWAVLWGDSPSVAQVASWAGTISYEALCRLSSRVPRKIREQY